MFTRPHTLKDETVVAALRAGWGFDATAVGYLAVGFGSHHWVAKSADGARRFVTVDELTARDFLGADPRTAFASLSTAFGAARTLNDDGLDWVVGPMPGTDGQVLRELDPKHSIAVLSYLEGSTTSEYTSEAERGAVVARTGVAR